MGASFSSLLTAAAQVKIPGGMCLTEEPALLLGGWFAEVTTEPAPALCSQINTQPRFQLNYQKCFSVLTDSTTGMEKEVSWWRSQWYSREDFSGHKWKLCSLNKTRKLSAFIVCSK